MSGACREKNVNESMQDLFTALANREVSFGEHNMCMVALNKVRKCLMENSKDFARIENRGKYEGE